MGGRHLLNTMEVLIVWLAGIPARLILIFFSVAGLFTGVFLISKPILAIKTQQRFYAKINWKMEPISMEKEIRHTRIMGWLLIVLLVAILFAAFFQKSILL